MDSKKLLYTLLSSGILLTIIYALLYFWGYIYYDTLISLFGFSISNFDITLYEFLVAGSLSLIIGISIIAGLAIVLGVFFLFLFSQPIFYLLYLMLSWIKRQITRINIFVKLTKKVEQDIPIDVSNQLKKIQELLLEKYFVGISAIIYTFLVFWLSSLYSIKLAKDHFQNMPYKEAVIKLKNGEKLYCFYRTNIGDKVICTIKNNLTAIEEGEILLIQLKDDSSVEPENSITEDNKKN